MGDKNIRVDEDIWKLVSHRATDEGLSVKAVTEQAIRAFVEKGQAAQRAVDEIVTAHADDPTQWGPPVTVPATPKSRRDTNRTTVSTADEPAELVTRPVTPSPPFPLREYGVTLDIPVERIREPDGRAPLPRLPLGDVVRPSENTEEIREAPTAAESGPPLVPVSKPMTSIRDVAQMIRQARGEVTDSSNEPGDDYLRPRLLVRCKNGLCGHEQGKHREGTGPCTLMACPCARFRL